MTRATIGGSDRRKRLVLLPLFLGIVAAGLVAPGLPERARAERQYGTSEVAPVRPYDALDAGAEAYLLHEAKRRKAVGEQLAWNEQMKWWAGYRPYPAIVPPTSVWGLDEIYSGLSPSYAAHSGYGPNFSPWPLVANDIWSYRFPPLVPQPVGRQQIQTAPDRWESHPLYLDRFGRPVRLGQLFSEPPPVAVPDPLPATEPPAAAPLSASGPREF